MSAVPPTRSACISGAYRMGGCEISTGCSSTTPTAAGLPNGDGVPAGVALRRLKRIESARRFTKGARSFRERQCAVGVMGVHLLARRRYQSRGILGGGRVQIKPDGYLTPDGLTLASPGRELRGEHHLLQRLVERGIRRLEHGQPEPLGLAKGVDDRAHDGMPCHTPAQEFGRIDEFRARKPGRALVQLTVGVDSEPSGFRFEHIGESGGDLIQAVDSQGRIRHERSMEIHAGETIVAAHVRENRAPYKHVHRIHQVRRCPECVVERGIGFVELMRGDVRTGGRDECVGRALRCKCGDKQDEGNREAETAQHGIDYAA